MQRYYITGRRGDLTTFMRSNHKQKIKYKATKYLNLQGKQHTKELKKKISKENVLCWCPYRNSLQPLRTTHENPHPNIQANKNLFKFRVYFTPDT